MSEKIIVLVDIAHSNSAVALLTKAKTHYAGKEIHLAYVMPYGNYSYVEPFVSKESQENAAQCAHAELDALTHEVGLSKASRHVLRGGIGDQVFELAKKLGATVLVLNAVRLGSHYSTLGTHAAQIVRHAPCDVHIMRCF